MMRPVRRFSYDGFDLSGLLHVESVDRPLLPQVSVDSSDYAGRDGERFESSRLGALEVTVKVRVIVPERDRDLRGLGLAGIRRLLASRLRRPEPRPLVLPDEPDVALMAVLSGDTSLERLSWSRSTELTFWAPDPRALGRRVVRTSSGGAVACAVGGSARTGPTIEVTCPAGDVTLQVDGAPLRLLGVPEGTGPVVVDGESMSCTRDGAWVKVNLADDLPMWEPGRHSVECDSPFVVSWVERWF